jgi:DNA-binding NtrC family response regulator
MTDRVPDALPDSRSESGLLGAQYLRDFAPLLASSARMRAIRRIIEEVASTNAAVLVRGESGVGKEVVARAIHAASPRHDQPFVKVNCAALPADLLESELFGHEKGAFTGAYRRKPGKFEFANKGTIFLDEIGDLPRALQAKLLHVLQDFEFSRIGGRELIRVDARVIAATNADLAAEVEAGRFRRDLLFRLNTVEIHLPSLRERREDIPLLAAHFLERIAGRYRKPIRGFEPAAMEQLLVHPWPGNVRELEHAVERAVLMATGDTIRVADLGLRPPSSGGGASLDELSLEEVERILIRKALDRYAGNVSQAAEALGLSRSALYRRFRRHGL